MVGNPILRHHAPPVRHVCIVSEGEDACGRELGREEGLGPRLGRVAGGPCLLAVASQAVDKDDARLGILARCYPGAKMYALDGGVCRVVKRLDARGESLRRRRGRGGWSLWLALLSRRTSCRGFWPPVEESSHSAAERDVRLGPSDRDPLLWWGSKAGVIEDSGARLPPGRDAPAQVGFEAGRSRLPDPGLRPSIQPIWRELYLAAVMWLR